MSTVEPHTSAASRATVRVVPYDDPAAVPVLQDLEREYDARYGAPGREPSSVEIYRYPVEAFSEAGGGVFLVLELDGEVVAGGAFMRPSERAAAQPDPATGEPVGSAAVEVKRIWTRADHRREGFASRVMRELEDEARHRGVPEIILSTGARQPEAVGLYLALGYTPLFDVDADPLTIGHLYFHKRL